MSDTTKTLRQMQTRISLKIDTWANWHKSDATTQANKTNGDLVLARGEVAFVQVDTDIPPVVHTENGTTLLTNPNTVLFKVGDGTTAFKGLNWGSAIAADVYDWAKVTEVDFYKKLTGKTTATGTETFVVTTDFNEFKTSVIGSSSDASNTKTVFERIEAVEGLLGNSGAVATTYATKKELSDTKTELLGETGSDGKAVDGNTILSAKADAAEAKALVSALETGKVQDNSDAIDILFDDDTVTGSVAKAVADAKSELKGKSTDTASSETIEGAKKFATDADIALKKELLGDADTADTIKGVGAVASEAARVAGVNTAKLTGLVGETSDNDVTVQEAINKAKADAKSELVGDATVSGLDSSVEAPTFSESTTGTVHTITGAKKYAYDLVKNLLTAYILDDNGDAIDKLNEIAAWIADDDAGAAKIISDLALKQDASAFTAWVASEFNPVKTDSHTHEKTDEQITAAVNDSHTHANSDVLDGITEDKVEAWDAVSNKANQSDLDALEAAAFTEENVFYIDCGTSTTVIHSVQATA